MTTPLHALAEITLAGLSVTFVPTRLDRVWWKVDGRDPARTVVLVADDLDESGLVAELPGILGALGQLAERRRRRGLRAVEPAPELELTAPVRPALRVLGGVSPA